MRKKRNYFLSYHHEYDQGYVKILRSSKEGMRIADYSLKENISSLTDEKIYQIIREKMRSCSVTIILIGEMTGHRKWIDWEIWASLRGYKNNKNPLKSFKPKGLLAIYLPTKSHSIPERLQQNIDSGYAVSMNWRNIERDLESKINYAIWKRDNTTHKIKNTLEKVDRNYLNFLGFKI
ncbi:MTH538 TIR-like domain [Tenacibaculum sp. MAR_2010_89]|uniref:TIR domain-containing protein n=1 Tax=Tenacibaculum sp. MAR_2010_89 TaxID=1250198 RepID=UPI000898A39F|nr:TIR domain-containing protein [Tenacibaculum sp. MAR_2010_89]SEE18432.1 MTH538 TIR-like domain [Tenacibaculum sp. MAR_2010_89]